MKIIAVSNRKGGCGKTTVATHLAGVLAISGENVLLVDTDPQGHAGLCLGIRKESGLFKLIVDSADIEEVIRPVAADTLAPADDPPRGRLFVLPSDEKTQAIPILEKNPFALMQRLDELDGVFDTIILDTAPTVTMFDGSVYLAAQAILYVTECETLALDGLKSGLKQITEFAPQRLQSHLPPTQVLGIVPNKYREKTANHAANLAAIKEKFGEMVWEPVALRTVLSEATNIGKLVFAYAPTSDAAATMWDMGTRFREAVQTWQNE